MGHYDCKSCHATPYQEHSADCERFPPKKKGITEAEALERVIEQLEAEKAARAKTIMENAALKAEIERLRSTNLTDVELEAACHAVGIFVYGPDAERFEKMFDAAMTARTALERIDHD